MAAAGQAGTPQKPVGKAGPMDTEKFFHFSAHGTTVMQMKAQQQAVAVKRVQRLLRAAWDESKK